MSEKLVYLAGPISGLSYEECTSWRSDVYYGLKEVGIKSISPMRFKNNLINEEVINGAYENVLCTAKAITTRDHFDCKRCDVILINLLNTKKISVGTVMEIAWGHAYGKPMVLVIDDKNVHNHPMILECCGFVVNNLELAVDVIKSILL